MSLDSSVSASEFGPGSGEVEDERVGRGNERGDPPLRGHRDEARFVLGAESDPAVLDADGEGGPVNFDECLSRLVYKPKELDLGCA